MSDFEEIKKELLQCRLCENIFPHEPRPIFQGNPHAKIFQISQAPSIHVHESGLPFNDASGKRLRQEWYQISDACFYDPNNFYIASMGHCYPGKKERGGDCLPPKHCAEHWLQKEMAMVDNELYIIIGALAASYIFPKIPFHDLVFNTQTLHDRKAFILPHPSPFNNRWLKQHPKFISERLPLLRKVLHEILGIPFL